MVRWWVGNEFEIMCNKRPVLLYRELITSHLRGGIKENNENLSWRTVAIGEIWTCDLLVTKQQFLSEKILDRGSQLHGATSLHWCNWPSGPIILLKFGGNRESRARSLGIKMECCGCESTRLVWPLLLWIRIFTFNL